jgi:hypothetical protein
MIRKQLLAVTAAAMAFAVAAAVALATPAAVSQHQAMSKQFTVAADANCAALGKLIAPLGNPKTLPGVAHKLAIVVPAFTMALRAQAELVTFDAPAAKPALVQQWMSAMTRYDQKLAAIHAAAAAGRAAAVTKENAQLTTIGVQAASTSKQLGLHVCFQS